MPLAAPKNPNYAATVVALKDFVDLKGCDNVKAALIYGNSIIVSKDSVEGQYGLYFPVETALSHQFLAANNLYRKPEWGNVDTEQKGFFEQQGRVKAMKFRGHKSEGFFIPLGSLTFIAKDMSAHDFVSDTALGNTFDTLNGIEICHKYVPKGQRVAGTSQPRGKQPKLEDSIVDGQFRFHIDTENLRRNVHKLNPTDFISVTDKWHGTSVVIGKLLVKRELSWFERVVQKLGFALYDQQYGLTYSSRRVIKAVNGVQKGTGRDFYSQDIWGIVAKEVADRIPDGFTLYGEIVGYTPDGAPIQKGYAYGCPVGGHEFRVYRVTLTTRSGLVVELSWPQLTEFCGKYGFKQVPEFFCGMAENLVPFGEDETIEEWQNGFLKYIENAYVCDQDCPYNEKGTPAEGVVVRVDHLSEAESFKCKNFRFLESESKALDQGVLDTETAEAESVDILANAA